MGTSRTRTTQSPTETSTNTYTPVTGASTVVTYNKVPYKRTTTDVVTQGFKKLSAEGQVINNPYSSVAEWYASDGTYLAEWYVACYSGTTNPDPSKGFIRNEYVNGAHFDCGWIGFKPAASLDVVPLVDKAKLKAAAAVNKMDVMAMVTVAEWHKTKVLHRQVGQGLLKIFKGVYSKNPISTSKALANAWLLGRYGVMPTVYELQGAVKLLERQKPLRETARAMETSSISQEDTIFLDESLHRITVARITTVEATVRAGILYENQIDMIGTMARMGFTRPLSAAYELIKFSWMLDWWIDVGTWLDAIQPDGSSKHLAAWITVNVRTTMAARVVSVGYKPGYNVTNAKMYKTKSVDGMATKVVNERTRTPWSGNLPALPSLGTGLNGVRCSDMISLVIQKLGYRGRPIPADGLRF